MTLKLPLAVFPCASVAKQVTVVLAIGNVLPDAGEQLTATAPSTRSLAEALKLTADKAELARLSASSR